MKLVAYYGAQANGKFLLKEVRDVVHIAPVNNVMTAFVISVDGKSLVAAPSVPDFAYLSTTSDFGKPSQIRIDAAHHPGDGR